MKYKKNPKRFSVKGRGEYMSKADFILKYYSSVEECIRYFFEMRWPEGYFCEKCGSTHFYNMSDGKYRCKACHHDERLLSGTCFQDNKLPLNKLLYGIFLVLSSKESISSVALAEELKVNYKTATLLQKKCRILMRQSNNEKVLDSKFYESDVAYLGAPSKGKPGMASDKQPFLIVLTTAQENKYPEYIKLREISIDRGENIEPFFKSYVKMGMDRLLNTDGKTTYNCLSSALNLCKEKIDYKDSNHRLYFLNKIVSNINSVILGVYHGICKHMLPLYFSEFEWRFNHRHTKDYLGKIMKYLRKSSPMTRKSITETMNNYASERGLV